MVDRKHERQSNLELLRIVAMVMIICCHFATYNDFGPTNIFSTKILGLSMLRLGGKTGVILFVMVTGYFMISKPFKWKRIMDLSRQTIFFSIVMALLAFVTEGIRPGVVGVLKIVFPLLLENYWFLTDFALILLLSPILNKLVHHNDKRLLFYGLVVAIGFTGLPIVTPDMKNNLIGLAIAYVLGAYIHTGNIKLSNLRLLSGMVTVLMTTTVITGVLIATSRFSHTAFQYRLFFVTGFNISAFCVAFLMFLAFEKWKFGNASIINLVASTTFGVYLFHDSRVFRNIMWHKIINPTEWHGTNLLFGFILTIVSIFGFGMMMDFVRQFMFRICSEIVAYIKKQFRSTSINDRDIN